MTNVGNLWPVAASLNDTFHTYVMFLPPGAGSRWVAVKQVDWTLAWEVYKGIPGNPNGWYLGPYSDPTASAPLDVTNPPIWDAKWQDGNRKLY
jgi:hypothetical protein